MSKMCPHIQVMSAPVLDAIRRVKPPMVKIMDPSRNDLLAIRAASPTSLIVARRYAPDQSFDAPLVHGTVFANMYSEVIDLIDVAEVYNEPVNNTTPPDAIARFDEFQEAFAHRIWELRAECKVGLFCLPTGNFSYPGEPTFKDFPKSLALPKDKVFICVHEYAWYTWDGDSPARCLRYRRQMDGLTGHKVLITECGLTQMVLAGHPDIGWRSGVERNVFIDGAAWYDSELQKDHYVVGAAMFNCGPSYGWDTFECAAEWEEAVKRAPVVIEPRFETPIRVLVGENVVTMELEEYLRGVVPAEMYPVQWPASSGLGASEDAALQAQAVASRTYALWRIANPRSESFDVYGDARDQVYDPQRIHDHTDTAVGATRGVTVCGITARYVSTCGRLDCPYCQGANGYDGKTWGGRMCQYGAQALARRGLDFHEILKRYYGEIVFSDGWEWRFSMGKTLYKDPATDAFAMANGLVTGCRVDVRKAEYAGQTVSKGQTVYRVVSLAFINEEQARGDTRIRAQVLGIAGNVVKAKVINAWPQQRAPNWDETAYDWASPAHWAEFAQGGGNYSPDKDGPLGPYVLFVEMPGAASDWCVGFGLPGNRHVAYEVVFQECTAYVDDVDIGPEEPPDKPGCGALVGWIIKLLQKVQ